MFRILNRRILTGDLFNEANLIEETIEIDNGIVNLIKRLHVPQVSLIVPVTENKELILIRQLRYAIGESILEFPAGKIEKNESPIAVHPDGHHAFTRDAMDIRPDRGYWLNFVDWMIRMKK